MSKPITLAQLGWIHEFGTTRSGRGHRTVIPARPFLIPGIMENRETLKALAGDLLKKVLNGHMSKRNALGKIGGAAEYMVKEKIRRGPFQELAESTIANKTVRGLRGDTPLIAIGNMRQNVQWEYDTE